MTKIVIKKLIWDEYNIEHIKKHEVAQAEVEEVAKNIVGHKQSKLGRYLIIGRTGPRIISVAVSRKAIGIYYPVTARDASKKERKIVYEKEKI
ncbi:hypothetical protein HYU94_02570 [Candidatus Daviesbacteria bacterium]|nr:hypothetical protein [Candidatus Daviesbacteria bacterium]